MKTIDLSGAWLFKALDPDKKLPHEYRGLTAWMPASVPGTVHTDLLALGKIPDPFYRLQENDVQWIDTIGWCYRREFVVPDDVLRERSIQLVAEGLDTFARISCNGRPVGRAANMFLEHRFDIKRSLRKGLNAIEIQFDSPTELPKVLEARHGRLEVALEPHRVYARKAQYSYGWDWGPKLTTSGIWRGISIMAYSHARMTHPRAKVTSLGREEALVTLSVDLKRFDRAPVALRAHITDGTWSTDQTAQVRTATGAFRVRIPHPRFWWPNGYGGQPLYKALLSLSYRGEILQELETTFALRTVRLIQERDAEGTSFILEINGVRIFCKGADWIPCDTFIPRIAPGTRERLLRLASEAHMNMIRVWGGGTYEQDEFYDLCDRLGLMVWQDFMFACGEYPEVPWFMKQVAAEARAVVGRLQNHPSIVVWCGNNECEWIYCTNHPGKRADDMRGAKIFRDLLPAVCKAIDGSRPYWRSSPFGKGFPNDERSGNHHQWEVWSLWKDYREYEKDHARFVTEFGFQGPASRRTFDQVTLPCDRHPQSRVMEHHNKQVEGTERLFRFQAGHLRIREDLDGFIHNGQIVQAEALKRAVEHWRRRKFSTAGALFWQLNDCWPVSSWAVIDSGLRPKAAYFYARRFYAPVLVSFGSKGKSPAVWITNDRLSGLNGQLALTLLSFEGSALWSRIQDVRVAANESRQVVPAEQLRFPPVESTGHYLRAQLSQDGKVVAENRFFFEEPKHLHLPAPFITTTVREIGEGEYILRLETRNYAMGLCIEFHGEDVDLEDNFFDMDAGAVREIRFRSALSRWKLRRKLRLRWIGS